jgi:hypothetical protein
VRFLVLALTLVFAAAPVAADVCETTCVEHAGHSPSTSGGGSQHHHGSMAAEHAGHHHHATQATGSPTVVLAPSITHDCCFSVAVVSDSRDITRAPMLRGGLTAATNLTVVRAAFPTDGDNRHGRPAPISSLTQLRV